MNKNYVKIKDQAGSLGDANDISGTVWDISDWPRLIVFVFSKDMWQEY